MKGAPIYRDTFSLCGVLLAEVEAWAGHEALRRRLGQVALRLLEQVTLALGDRPDREHHLRGADLELRLLRTHSGLALELGLLEEDLYLDLVEQADLVGRQVGGWLRKL